LKVLAIKNFRNLSIPETSLPAGPTIIVGGNGQGKTNMLEAIHFLSYGRPFKGTKDQVINWGETESLLRGTTDNESITINIKKDQKTKVLINGKTKKSIDLLGRFVSVAFYPEEISIITGQPSLRRSWLDKLISTIDKEYLRALVRYQRSLKNRNRLLKTGGYHPESLEVWDRNLAKFGTKIWFLREGAVHSFNQIFRKKSVGLTGKPFTLQYKNPINKLSPKEAEEYFLRELKLRKDIESRLLVSVFGPHRDDINLLIEEQAGKKILEKNVSTFGSRGEQRQATILLKLAEADFFTQHYQKHPTILLDDVSSELDKKNQRLLFSNLLARQVIITTTDEEPIEKNFKTKPNILRIVEGKITAI